MEQFFPVIFDALKTGSPAVSIMLFVMYWMERKDNRDMMKDLSVTMQKIVTILEVMKAKKDN